MTRGGSTYIMANKFNTTIYTGSTDDLLVRIKEHRLKKYPNAFTSRYNITKLVFFKHFSRIEEAREYERYIKGKSRKWKQNLIEKENPYWLDLTDELQ